MTEKKQNPIEDDVYYGAILSAFVNNSFERDKAFLTLCPAAIGLLITVAITVGINSWLEAILFFLSSISFGITTYHLIKVFDLNKEYLRIIIKNKKDDLEKIEKKLKNYDQWTFRGFMISVILFFLFGLTMAYTQYIIKNEVHNGNEKQHFQFFQF